MIFRVPAVFAVTLLLGPAALVGVPQLATAQTDTLRTTPPTETLVSGRASGTFEVTLAPLDPYDDAEGSILGRMSMDKVFHGDLVGASRGEMLTAVTPTPGSAGYVALERFEGALQGRSGSFVLQHSGTMNRGEPSLALSVVPDSGTGELEGLTGAMTLEITEEGHFWEFDFTLPEVDRR